MYINELERLVEIAKNLDIEEEIYIYEPGRDGDKGTHYRAHLTIEKVAGCPAIVVRRKY